MIKAIQDITKGNNLEKSLPEYANYMMDCYNQAAHIRFVMNYYTYYEILSEYDGRGKEDIKEIVDELNKLVNKTILKVCVGEEFESVVKEISDIRNKVIEKMHILTTYVDSFSIYEHVLNRVENRFSDKTLPDGYSDEEMTRKIMSYIISDEDNVVINAKITQIIAELPIRMVKNKFYEYVNEGINVYETAGKDSFDEFIYLLRTVALLDTPTGFEEEFGDLNVILNELSSVRFSDITSEAYKKLVDKLNFVADMAHELSDMYVMIAELVNALYSICLTSPYVTANEDVDVCKTIDTAIYNLFMNNENSTVTEDVEDLMIKLEGRPERIMEKYQEAEFALETVKAQYMGMAESIMCNHIYESLFVCQKLASSSLFMELIESDEDNTLETGYFREKRDKLIEDMAVSFKENDKMVNRAIMATVLASLPVFFNNMTEIKDYVMASLDSCRDEAEKTACIEIVNTIMES